MSQSSDTPASLATPESWSESWQNAAAEIRFDPERLPFGEVHDLIRRHLAPDPGRTVIEIGTFPGRYLWYFAKFFGYRPYGIEYIDWCCERAAEELRKEGVEATLYNADLFTFEPPAEPGQWDVVFSAGFVEHFEDPSGAIARHWDLLRPGGTLVLVIPNHTGMFGRIMRLANRNVYKLHNRMSCSDLAACVKALPGAEILEEGYYGRFSLAHVGLFQRTKPLGPLVHYSVRAPVRALEILLRFIPNCRVLSTNAAVVARKKGTSSE